MQARAPRAGHSPPGARRFAARIGLVLVGLMISVPLLPVRSSGAQAVRRIDLAEVPEQGGLLRRVYGSVGEGSFGVPVAGGADCDGDGAPDYALASMRASPAGRSHAGLIHLVFGDGTLQGPIDTAGMRGDILEIIGAAAQETAGGEIWMEDVTGDGVGELLIGRQNYTADPNRIGAGALTILVGGSELRSYAQGLQVLDLAAPPPTLTLTTLVGAHALDRLGIWFRTGDVTGDGIADIVVGADQEGTVEEPHRGAVYLVRCGPHLAVSQTIDLRDFGSSALAGHLARIEPPKGSGHFHFGATCQIADRDGNQRGEVLVAAALSRAGAAIRAEGAGFGSAHATGGSLRGTLYIAWDGPNFSADPWPAGLSFEITRAPGGHTIVRGGSQNVRFGEEILGGHDYDADGLTDLFVGDLEGDGSPPGRDGFRSGLGHVLYNAPSLKGLEFDMDTLPVGLTVTTFLGAARNDLAADTALHGDFDGDGIADLVIGLPHASTPERHEPGALYLLHGQPQGWPERIELGPTSLPPPARVRIVYVLGAHGASGPDRGDMLAYSAAAGDLDGDCRDDLLVNEMTGNGLAATAVDVGNLLAMSGALLQGLSAPLPGPAGCGDIDGDGCVLDADVEILRRQLADPAGAPLPPGAEQRCTVIGDPAPCDLLDAVSGPAPHPGLPLAATRRGCALSGRVPGS